MFLCVHAHKLSPNSAHHEKKFINRIQRRCQVAGEGLLWPYNYLGCAVKSQIPLQLHMVHYKLRHTFIF